MSTDYSLFQEISRDGMTRKAYGIFSGVGSYCSPLPSSRRGRKAGETVAGVHRLLPHVWPVLPEAATAPEIVRKAELLDQNLHFLCTYF